MINSFLIALQFLTILPVKIEKKIDEKDFGGSLFYFPIIGLLLGLFLSSIAFVLAPLPSLVRSILILSAWITITGGIHLDGFADTCDGFYGNRSREEILRIMRDSRIGTMGAAGITTLILFKFAVLSSVQPEYLWKVLVISTVFARWSQVLACSTSKYARSEGKAKHFMEYAKKSDTAIAALFTLAVYIFFIGFRGIILFGFLSALIFLFIQYVKKKIGGMTGDTIGATNEIAEALALLLGLVLLNYKI